MTRIAPHPLSDTAAADAIPGYRLEAFVAHRDGRATSYRARRLGDEHDVLLTVVAPELGGDGLCCDRFERWTRMRATFSHAALPRFVDAGTAPAGLFLAVEDPQGIPLSQLLAGGPLSPDRVLSILEPVADLLGELRADRAAVVCPAPGDIMIGHGDRPTVTDLGLLERCMPQRGAGAGDDALAYMAPEQLRGLASGARTDVYNLAVVVFEALTATRPFRELSPGGNLSAPSRVLKAKALPPPAVSARRFGLGPGVDAVVKRALAEDPMARPSDPRKFLERFRVAVEKAVGAIDRPSTAPLGTRRLGLDATIAKATASSVVRERPRPERTSAATIVPGPPPRARSLPATPALDTDPKRRFGRRSRVWLTAAAALCAGAASSTFVLGDEPEPRVPPARTVVATSGAVSIRHPSTWHSIRPAPRLPGLPMADELALVPRDTSARGDVRLVAGIVERSDERLLPPGLGRRGDGGAAQEPVRLGSLSAYRYRDIRVGGGDRRMTVYAVPTDAGVATVACVGPATAPEAGSGCEEMATTIELRQARPLPLGPNVRFARSVNAALRRLDARRRTERGRLARAQSVAGQGRRAADLARAFAQAGSDVQHAPVTAGTERVRARVRADLGAIASAYRALAAGAVARDRAAYAVARNTVRRTEARLFRTLSSLRRLGYRVR